MQALALAGVGLFGLWLAGVSWLMVRRPADCLRWLRMMASTWRINAIELGLRALAGLAFIVRADDAKTPEFFAVLGWFLLVSAIVIWLLPRRLHAAFAIYCSRRLTPAIVRILAPLSGLAGFLLTYLAI